MMEQAKPRRPLIDVRPAAIASRLHRPAAVVLLVILALAALVMVSHKQGPEVFHDFGARKPYDGAFFHSIAVSPVHAAPQPR
jgi:hypothetical protein